MGWSIKKFNPIKSITRAVEHVGQETKKAIKSPGHALGQLGTGMLTTYLGGAVTQLGGKHSINNMIWDPIFGSKQGPDPGGMPTAPDQKQAIMGSLGDSLQRELEMRRASALMTGGDGQDGDSVKTAGQLLVGS